MLKYTPIEGGEAGMMQITYQKRDGSIIQKLRRTELPYKVGETTSMGWKVLSVEYEYKNKFYPEYEFNRLLYKCRKAEAKKKQIIESCTKEFKKIMYYLIAIAIINFLKMLFGI